MIGLDTGPIVALFDPRDQDHADCRLRLAAINEPMFTTLPVLTEAFHILSPGSKGSAKLRDFIGAGGVEVFFADTSQLHRMMELMEQYSDHPMDLADASIVAGAEALNVRRVFTLDVADFSTYRLKRGHRHYPIEIV